MAKSVKRLLGVASYRLYNHSMVLINKHSVVILDTTLIHHVHRVTDLINHQASAHLLFLLPYSPDLSLIEEVLSQVKTITKKNEALFQVTIMPVHY